MAFPRSFISLSNFELAFARIVRGQNKEYKRSFRHLYPSYQLGLRDNLEDLIDDLRRGRFKPSAATCVFQPKRNGILRPLRLLTLQDQIVYQAIANVIAIAFKPVQDKYAFRRCFGALVGEKTSPFFYQNWKYCYRSFNRAITAAFRSGNDFVADFDLVSFYELIDHNLLKEVLERRIKEPSVLELLFRCLEKWTENRKGSCLHHGIPQGPEPSAFLAECLLFDFDARHFKDVVYLRYVDDIKLMAKDEPLVKRALLKLDMASKELGLVPQAQKIECRRITSINELRKNIPSGVASISSGHRVTGATQRRLERLFRRSLKKKDRQWTIIDPTKLKFSLFRMNPRADILRRVSPLLSRYPDLSWTFTAYLCKFPKNKQAADTLLDTLKRDPTYDASAANYIEAMDICEPAAGTAPYRRVIQTAERRTEEKGLLLKIVQKQKHPLSRGILFHRLFGLASRAPFKVTDGLSLIEEDTKSADADLARFCAVLLLDRWPWTRRTWIPGRNVNRSVKLLLKSLGLRARAPNKVGVLDHFFQERMNINIKFSWRRALGANWRDAERRCLRLQQFEIGDPTPWVLMIDTFNEVLLQEFSTSHPAIAPAYARAIPPGGHHPDLGGWLNNSTIARQLPKGIGWFKDVHDTRVKADMAHAKSRKGVATKPVPFPKRDELSRRAKTPWAELIIEWKKVI